MFSYTTARTHTPLWKVAEIATSMGIPTMQLARALKKPGAPKPRMNGAQRGHTKPRDWYEPTEVRKWYAQYELNDPAAARREYHRMNYAKRNAA